MRLFDSLTLSVISFSVGIILLLIYSLYDVRNRSVPNMVSYVGIVLVMGLVLVDGQLLSEIELHVTAILFSLVLSYVLYRMGAVGGADVKALVALAIVSPGAAFVVWENPFLEAVINMGIVTGLMLLFGFLYWRLAIDSDNWNTKPPLIPFLLLSFIIIQCIFLV
ncbi:MAG: prepilin peptidase [Candidatus Thorarchaeota archaeon]|nr:MAG: prepilin peptidase [Candidatus Thorarchaeota archaeon]